MYKILVSLDPITRKSGDKEHIYVLDLDFLKMLWSGEIFWNSLEPKQVKVGVEVYLRYMLLEHIPLSKLSIHQASEPVEV